MITLIKMDKTSETERTMSLTIDGATELRKMLDNTEMTVTHEMILQELLAASGIKCTDKFIYNEQFIRWKNITAAYNHFHFRSTPEEIIKAWEKDPSATIVIDADENNANRRKLIQQNLQIEQWAVYCETKVADEAIVLSKLYETLCGAEQNTLDSIRSFEKTSLPINTVHVDLLKKALSSIQEDQTVIQGKVLLLNAMRGNDILATEIKVNEAYRAYRGVDEKNEQLNVEYNEQPHETQANKPEDKVTEDTKG